MPQKNIDKILEKYKLKLKQELGEKRILRPVTSAEYKHFKQELLPKHLSWYEQLCNLSERFVKIQPDKEKEKTLKESIDICHLEITPAGATSFALIMPLFVILFGSLISLMLLDSFFFLFLSVIIGIILMYIFQKLPIFFANNWRLNASNQMVISVFYVVTYMRHTSNLENALNFAAEHLSGTLALDFKKVLWNIETGEYSTITESLDNYLETWRKWNMEFIEAFHLIESSLYEGSEDRRLNMLDKSLEVILDETYEKMLHYAQNLKSPITMLHMMGIVLPILGLVILPLVVSFVEGVKWYHLASLYNILLPLGVYYMGKNILSKRPTGYGDTDIAEEHPELKKYRKIIINLGFTEITIQPIIICVLVWLVLFIIGMSPVIIHYLNPEFDISIMDGTFRLLDYKESEVGAGYIGPFGLGAAILSLFVTISFALGIGLYYKLKSKKVINIRNKTKELENEFASALFQLGNRLGDGLPAEIAFAKVADVMHGTKSGEFFQIVDVNIKRLGMSVKEALFNSKIGAIVSFPSKLIMSSMKVLIEASKKGPKVASQALLNISEYIKEIHRVNERLIDLMSDVIASMKSQISFLTPVIAGIVIGITSMVTSILGSLGEQMTKIAQEGGGEISTMSGFFGQGIPTFHFQVIVGIYVVQIIFILTILVNGIENGSDKLNERYLLGVNMVRSVFFYSVVALFVMLIFNFVAAQIMGPISAAGI